jgi:hypothetical protein
LHRFLHIQSDWILYTNALTWTLLSRGIPIIYYGTSFGFDGGNDPSNREALWPAGYNITNAPLGQLLKALNSIRRKNKITGAQQQIQRYADDSFYAFTRGVSASDASSMFVAMTNAGQHGETQTRKITFQPYPDGTVLCNALTSDEHTAVWGIPGGTTASMQMQPGLGSSTLLNVIAHAGNAAHKAKAGSIGQMSRTESRVLAAAEATKDVVQRVQTQHMHMRGPQPDCVMVAGGQFEVSLTAGQPKIFIPQ